MLLTVVPVDLYAQGVRTVTVEESEPGTVSVIMSLSCKIVRNTRQRKLHGRGALTPKLDKTPFLIPPPSTIPPSPSDGYTMSEPWIPTVDDLKVRTGCPRTH